MSIGREATHRQGRVLASGGCNASVCLRVVRNEGACGCGSWLEGFAVGVARLPFRMARDLCSAAHAQVAQMFGFRMQFVSVHVSLRHRWGQVAC